MTRNDPKILIVGPSWVGDMVMAQSLFKVLHQQYPEARLDVLAPPWAAPLTARMPEVEQNIELPIGHGELKLSLRRQIGRQLKNNHYDQAIVLPNSLKSALIPWWADIAVRTGFTGEMRLGLLNDRRTLDKQRLSMTVQRFVSLGLQEDAGLPDEIPAPSLSVNEISVNAARIAFKLESSARPVLALCPGAEFGEAKRWPEEHYATIAGYWNRMGWQVWLFGSEKDRPVCERIISLSQIPAQNLAGRTTLEQAIDLLSLAEMVVSNDSGLMHIAAALNRPTVAVYGSSDPSFTPPLSKNSQVVRLGLDCSPCFKRECPLGHLNCLKELSPDLVLAAMSELV